MSLMVVGRQSKIILHTQPIKIFKIVTLINVYNLFDNSKCFDWLSVQSCFGLFTHHH